VLLVSLGYGRRSFDEGHLRLVLAVNPNVGSRTSVFPLAVRLTVGWAVVSA
jgi:hypothetical protein